MTTPTTTLYGVHRYRNGGRHHDPVAESMHATEEQASAVLTTKGTKAAGYYSPGEYGFVQETECVVVDGVAYPVASGTKV